MKAAFKKLFTEYSYLVSFILILAIAASTPTSSLAQRVNIPAVGGEHRADRAGHDDGDMRRQIDIGRRQVATRLALASVLNATGSIWLMLLFCLAMGAAIGLSTPVGRQGRMPA